MPRSSPDPPLRPPRGCALRSASPGRPPAPLSTTRSARAASRSGCPPCSDRPHCLRRPPRPPDIPTRHTTTRTRSAACPSCHHANRRAWPSPVRCAPGLRATSPWPRTDRPRPTAPDPASRRRTRLLGRCHSGAAQKLSGIAARCARYAFRAVIRRSTPLLVLRMEVLTQQTQDLPAAALRAAAGGFPPPPPPSASTANAPHIHIMGSISNIGGYMDPILNIGWAVFPRARASLRMAGRSGAGCNR